MCAYKIKCLYIKIVNDKIYIKNNFDFLFMLWNFNTILFNYNTKQKMTILQLENLDKDEGNGVRVSLDKQKSFWENITYLMLSIFLFDKDFL